jgi:PKD repeat protein
MKKSLITFAIGAILMAQPVSAASMADLQAQINSLVQIVQQLLVQVQNMHNTPQVPLPPIIIEPAPMPPIYSEYSLSVSDSAIYTGDTVVFTSSHGDGSNYQPSASDGRDTSIDFGDGSQHQWVHCFTGNRNLFSTGKCKNPAQYKHTYNKPGTYTARLVKEGGHCMAPGCPVTTLTDIQITVKAKMAICTREYRPVCARPQGCSPCPDGAYCAMLCQVPEPKTYSNKCEMKRANATYIHAGRCGVVNNTNTAPVVDSFSGPTKLEMNERGIWKVRAHDKENDSLTYDISWGDEPQIMYAAMRDSREFVPTLHQDTTFEHRYNNPGKYTVAIRVTDEHNLSTRSTITVTVIRPTHTGGGISNTCKSWYDGCNNCSRSYLGGPAMCTLRACSPLQMAPAYCQEHFNTTNTSCRVDDMLFIEGQTTNCINGGAAGISQCIADAHYVCRSGQWLVEGGLPLPTPLPEPVQQWNYGNDYISGLMQNLNSGNQDFSQILNGATGYLQQFIGR